MSLLTITFVDPAVIQMVEVFENSLNGHTPSASEDETAELAGKLCELSRDIRLELGPPDELPSDFVSRIISLFRSSAESLIAAPESDTALCVQNILIRADRIAAAARIG